MKPYPPELLDLPKLCWERLARLLGPANRAVAKFGGVLLALPNPEVLLSPLTTKEAVLSSKIEGTQATLGEVFAFEAGDEPGEESKRSDIFEILNYRNALSTAEKELPSRPFNLNLLLTLHEQLLDSVRGRDKGRGHFRQVQNWIGRPGCSLEQADFVPPAPDFIRPLMSDWEKFYHAEYPDLIVQLALIHARFEIIHPFVDGNGRLGRILVPLFMFEKGLLTRPVFYASGYLERNRDEYIARLRNLGTQEHAWEEWVDFFIKAITSQAEENASVAQSVLQLYNEMKQRIIVITKSQHAVPLLDQLFSRPIFSTPELEGKPGLPSKQMISKMVNQLRTAGFLTLIREASGRRPQIWMFPQLLEICEGDQSHMKSLRGRHSR